MPAMIACPNCEHPGPMGFNDPKPWGRHFYHSKLDGCECDGAWEYNGEWYKNEAGAWKAWLKDNPRQDEDWRKAFEAKIVRGDMAGYKRHIKKWRENVGIA